MPTTEVDDPTLTLLENLVSPCTGVLRRTLLLPYTGGQIRYSHATAAPARYGVLPTGGDIANPGASAWHMPRSLTQVAFEAVERYCAAFVDHGSMLRTAPQGPAFDAGRRVQQFAAHQYAAPGFPFAPLRDGSVVHWALGRSLLTGDRRYVPAAFTYLPFRPTSPDEVLGPSFSTGMSAAWTREAACLSGLLELVERDAFAITWLNRLPGRRIVPAPGSTMALRVAAVEADGASRVTLLDVRTDIDVPVVCAVLERHVTGRRLMAVGLSCKLDVATACDKALCEAISEYERLRVVLEDEARTGPWTPAPDFSDVVDFEWHGRVYTDPQRQDQLSFLLGDGTATEVDGDLRETRPGDLVRALRLVEPVVSDVVAVDLTTRDMHELGVTAVKVFAPELVPLNADHRYPYLGHDRLLRAAGRRAVAATPADLNPYPHPFS